jgi:hypothetical protein
LYDLFSALDPVFDFAKYVMQVSFFFVPTLSSTKVLLEIGIKDTINALVRNHIHTMSDLRELFEEQDYILI